MGQRVETLRAASVALSEWLSENLDSNPALLERIPALAVDSGAELTTADRYELADQAFVSRDPLGAQALDAAAEDAAIEDTLYALERALEAGTLKVINPRGRLQQKYPKAVDACATQCDNRCDFCFQNLAIKHDDMASCLDRNFIEFSVREVRLSGFHEDCFTIFVQMLCVYLFMFNFDLLNLFCVIFVSEDAGWTIRARAHCLTTVVILMHFEAQAVQLAPNEYLLGQDFSPFSKVLQKFTSMRRPYSNQARLSRTLSFEILELIWVGGCTHLKRGLCAHPGGCVSETCACHVPTTVYESCSCSGDRSKKDYSAEQQGQIGQGGSLAWTFW